jgi:hypothetical protein
MKIGKMLCMRRKENIDLSVNFNLAKCQNS